MLFRICVAPLFVALTVPADTGSLDQAVEFQQKGRLTEARDILRAALPALRASGGRPELARALGIAGQISISLGDYHSAAEQSGEAVDLCRSLQDAAHLADNLTTLGLAHLYLGHYPASITAYRQALAVDIARGSTEGEVTLLNNIGNAFYFQGRYLDALRSYEAALQKVNAASATWTSHRRQLTLANLATLYQRLGNETYALDLYRQLGKVPQLRPEERAQLLLNEGALYRRIGDPIKALQMYRAAETLFATDRHRDGEIGALRNTGIALAMDLGDSPGALEAFTTALRLAGESRNTRGVAQVSLYRAELRRRMGLLDEAAADARSALGAATSAGLAEEQWKAHYELGRIAEDRGTYEVAFDSYRKAAGLIEAVRTGLVRVALKKDFLADKRDVYDSLIALRLRDTSPSPADIFQWMERGRARTLGDRLGFDTPARLEDVQKSLAPDTVLVDLWIGERQGAIVWITADGIDLAQPGMAPDRLNELARQLSGSVQSGTEEWREPARILGRELLGRVPMRRHMLIVPDGPLAAIPFEMLRIANPDSLLVERADVSYLPSAQWIVSRGSGRRIRTVPPWQRELVALGDPAVLPDDQLGPDQAWRRLPTSAEEVRSIAALVQGKAEIHLGADARKQYLENGQAAGVPIIHLSTHAAADMENPDRSRILLAPESEGKPSDYMFQREVYDLDLSGVDMVTVSGCDTARGRLVRGEGVEAFSVAFLAAGAASAVTSLWKVDDQPTADFMRQFYYFVSRGEPRAEALRSAKLRFLHSGSPLSNPRYWAAFVLTGDGWNACAKSVSWSVLLAGAGAVLLIAGLIARRRAQRA